MSEGHVLIILDKLSVLIWGVTCQQEIRIDIPPDNRSGGGFFQTFQFDLSVLFNLILLHRERW